MPEERVQNELVLPLGQYAHILDETKGNVQTYSGPIKQSLSPQDKPVVFDPASRKFVQQARQADAVRNNIQVRKGDYVILENPHKDGNSKQPEPGKSEVQQHDGLRYGEVVNIAGPWSHPLWPQQVATVVSGHQMRSNQYLLARVYDDEAARKNWKSSVVKGGADKESSQIDLILGVDPESLVIGQILVIKGTKVGFYIPPSGIEVLKEGSNYVQDAVTLERLEYSILLGEDGEKDYRQGPDVVFPTPTQSFYTKETRRKFKAIELQPTSGIHVKVVKEYTEGDKSYKVGEELFITGKDVPIYFPREEHAAITYGGSEKTHAIAIPKGDSRYVLDREAGDVQLAVGPQMLLMDPRKQVMTVRTLTETECRLWYPNNVEALAVNKQRSGYKPAGGGASFMSFDSVEPAGAMPAAAMLTRSAFVRESAGDAAFADSMTRGTAYAPPRTVNLDGKYEGAPKIVIWPGHAVQVVDSKGTRRTEVGPKPVLLQWDEVLQPMSLSKGKPKNSDNLLRTAFLRFGSNPVSDVLDLVTSDLVNLQVRLKYLVRFEEEDKDRWFSLDNYVQYMCDHLRSLIATAVRRMDIQKFDREAATLIRDVVLGERPASGPRPLRHFEENGMTVYDVEIVAPIEIMDPNVEELLSSSRHAMMSDSVAAELLQAKAEFTEVQQKFNRTVATEEAATAKLKDDHVVAAIERRRKALEAQAQADMATSVVKANVEHTIAEKRRLTEAINLDIIVDADAQRDVVATAQHHRAIHLVQAEADSTEQRMKAVQPGLIEALSATALVGVVEKVAPAIASLAFVNGRDTESVLTSLFKGTAAEKLLENVKDLHHVAARRVNGAADHA